MVDKKQETEPIHLTASHWMLYVILVVYVLVALVGILFTGACIINEKYETGAQGLIIVGSIIGTCSCTIVGFYSKKAAKENEMKILNDKYCMKLVLIERIFKERGASLDDKSIDVLCKLLKDDDIKIPPEILSLNSVSGGHIDGLVQADLPSTLKHDNYISGNTNSGVTTTYSASTTNEEGLG